jgi:hypothetical protein
MYDRKLAYGSQGLTYNENAYHGIPLISVEFRSFLQGLTADANSTYRSILFSYNEINQHTMFYFLSGTKIALSYRQ